MAQKEIILITGANTGLGFEIVKALYASDKSYDIIAAGRSLAKIEDAIKTASAATPSAQSKLHPLQIDIEDDNSIEKAFEVVNSQFGKLDALINNAGISPSLHPSLTSNTTY